MNPSSTTPAMGTPCALPLDGGLPAQGTVCAGSREHVPHALHRIVNLLGWNHSPTGTVDPKDDRLYGWDFRESFQFGDRGLGIQNDALNSDERHPILS